MYNVSIKNQSYILVLLYAICGIGFIIAYLIKKYNNKYNIAVDKYNQYCMLYNKSDIVQELTKHRGIQYYFNGHLNNINDKKIILYKRKFCLITFWSMSHIILYALIGFFCPSLFIPSFVFGVIFEGLEKKFCNCQDLFDIIYNSIGFGIGYLLNKLYFNNFSSNIKIASIIVIIIVLLLLLDFINKIEDFSNQMNNDKRKDKKKVFIFQDIDNKEINSSITDDMI